MEWFALAFLSATLSAAAAITQKKILFAASALTFSFFLSLSNAALSAPLFFALDYSAISTTALAWLFAKAVMGAAAFYCVMEAIKRIELGGALPLLALTPGFVAVAAAALIGDAITVEQSIGLAALVVGTYVLETRENQKPLDPFRRLARSRDHYYLYAALLLFTATSVMDKHILSGYKLPPTAFLAFQHLFFAVIFAVWTLAARVDWRAAFGALSPATRWLILLVSVLTIGYRFAQIEALTLAPAALVLSVKRLSVLMATAAGGRLFREERRGRKIVAVLALLAGATIVLVYK